MWRRHKLLRKKVVRTSEQISDKQGHILIIEVKIEN